jgi:hypothetical protein
MSSPRPLALVAVVVATLGLSAPALAQGSAAQPESPGKQVQQGHHGGWHGREHRGERFGRGARAQRMQGSMLQLVCSPRGTDRMERIFDRLGKRLDLTEAQSPLFAELRGAALIAQTEFADACTAARPEAGSDRPDFVDRLETRLKLEAARNAALTGLLPQLGAFYDSLSDEQKTRLEPRRDRERPHRGGKHDRMSIDLKPNRG